MTNWGLPPDLCRRQHQLRALELPETVDRLDWIEAPLRELRLVSAPVTDVTGVPRSVRRLDIRDSAVSSLRGLPPGVEELDATGCPLESLDGLPRRRLRRLGVSNLPVAELERLPPTLQSLRLTYRERGKELVDMRWASEQAEADVRRSLPKMTDLELEGGGILSLEGIPAGVERLAIRSSRPRIVVFPDRLRCLELIATDLGTAEIPDHLGQLVLTPLPGQTLAAEAYPPFLHRLSLRGATPLLDDLPRFLDDLRLFTDTGPRTLYGLPARLQRLHLVASGLELPADPEAAGTGIFPPDLVHLGLIDYRGARLPPLPQRQLRSLDLSWARIESPTGLPAGLRELDLTGVSVPKDPALLRGLGELGELRRLAWRSSALRRPPPLSPSLRHLDLSDSAGLDKLTGLPPSLTTLRVANTALRSLPDDLPVTLQLLDIRGTAIHELTNLPEGLKTLIAGRDQLSSLEGLPTSVETLRFLDPFDVESAPDAGCPPPDDAAD